VPDARAVARVDLAPSRRRFGQVPVMTLTPFATSRSAAGRYLADVVLGTTKAPTGSYVDRSRAERSSQESYDPRREGELWDAAERFTAAYAVRADALSGDVMSGSPR